MQAFCVAALPNASRVDFGQRAGRPSNPGATRPSPLRTPEGDRLIPGASSSFLGHFHPPKPQEITAVRNRMSKPEGLGGQQEECELHMWDFLPRR